jgi:hypothetical protein
MLRKGEWMNIEDQKAGEARVRALVVEPLQVLGLGKPSTMTKVLFEKMLDEMCAILAYMSAENLQQLKDQVAARPAGKSLDRFPILNKILPLASDIQEPEDTGSPLVRNVFAHEIGRAALRDGYAPELLKAIKKDRKFPSMWRIKNVRDDAEENMRKFRTLGADLAAGKDVRVEDLQWQTARVNVIERCKSFGETA